MSTKKRTRSFCIIIPICLCTILIIANLIQYFHFYRILNELYEICRGTSGENALALMEFANNLETDGLLTTGLTVISIAVTMWIGLNIYNVVNKRDMEKMLERYKKKEKKLQHVTKKVEFVNLLYLTGQRYYASDFFANLFWNTKMEYSNIDSIIKYEKQYIYCCQYYENNQKTKANIIACDLVKYYQELMSEKPYTIWADDDPMKNFLKMRLSDVLFYKNMTTDKFDMEEAAASIEYYNEIIKHKSEIKSWDDEIKAYFYNSQGYTLYHMSKHTVDRKKEYLDAALEKLKRAALDSPYKGRYKRNLGLIYQSKGKYNDARNTYIEALKMDPQDYKAYNTVTALDLKKFDEVTGIEDRTEILLDKIVFTDEIKQKWESIIDKDIRWCKVAEKISFSFVDTHYNMAKAYLYKYICEERTDSRLLDLAKEQIGIAEDLDSDAPGTIFIRRNIYEAEGNFAKAYKCVKNELIEENDKNDKLRKIYLERMQ